MNNERRLNMSEEEARKRMRELLNLPKEDLLTQYLFLQQENQELENQQKEFIDYMEEKIICYENYQNTNLGEYERNLYFDIYNDILEKYKEIIGDK